jgi:hypothetical protein
MRDGTGRMRRRRCRGRRARAAAAAGRARTRRQALRLARTRARRPARPKAPRDTGNPAGISRRWPMRQEKATSACSTSRRHAVCVHVASESWASRTARCTSRALCPSARLRAATAPACFSESAKRGQMVIIVRVVSRVFVVVAGSRSGHTGRRRRSLETRVPVAPAAASEESDDETRSGCPSHVTSTLRAAWPARPSRTSRQAASHARPKHQPARTSVT